MQFRHLFASGFETMTCIRMQVDLTCVLQSTKLARFDLSILTVVSVRSVYSKDATHTMLISTDDNTKEHSSDIVATIASMTPNDT